MEPIEIEMTTLPIDSIRYFSYASPYKGNHGEVTSGYYATKEESQAECLRMAEACWGNVIVTKED